MRKWPLAAAALLMAMPTWANTYVVGFEDTITTQSGTSDYDYNDLMFSMSGQTLSLVSNGTWYSKPVLGTSGTPFWNRHSYDGANMNAGYCVYGVGNCGTGAGLDPSAFYLASGNRQSVSNVFFSANGSVDGSIDAKFANDHNVLGWYNVSTPDHINWLAGSDEPGDVFHFTPDGDFGLVADNNGGSGESFYSTGVYGTPDDVSHFAFFGTDAPEPGPVGLLAVGLIALSFLLRRRILPLKR